VREVPPETLSLPKDPRRDDPPEAKGLGVRLLRRSFGTSISTPNHCAITTGVRTSCPMVISLLDCRLLNVVKFWLEKLLKKMIC
jgi:hypothetical protein